MKKNNIAARDMGRTLADKNGKEHEYLPVFLPGDGEEFYVRVVNGQAILDFGVLQMMFNDADELLDIAKAETEIVREDRYREGFEDGGRAVTKVPAEVGQGIL